jgi:HAD superfamily hydrolase (TIGR01549 family)|tara:strand:+ start:31696 stop:32409 length:714 start_codon:yes stop_codon:yes gene_type:complete
VFDKDGTLIDFHAVWGPRLVLGAKTLAAKTGLGDGFVNHLYRASGYNADTGGTLGQGPLATAPLHQFTVIVASVLFQHGLTWDRALALSEDHMGSAMTATPTAQEIIPRGTIGESLKRLVDAEIPAVIATTDNRLATEIMLHELGLEPFFADVRCGDDDGPVKPDIAVLAQIAHSQELDVSELVMVGDTVSDLTMARKAGAGLCVGITGGAGSPAELQAHADVLIGDISEIRPVPSG